MVICARSRTCSHGHNALQNGRNVQIKCLAFGVRPLVISLQCGQWWSSKCCLRTQSLSQLVRDRRNAHLSFCLGEEQLRLRKLISQFWIPMYVMTSEQNPTTGT